jgi:LysR family transcriptional regulator, transcriptional activator for dmlA
MTNNTRLASLDWEDVRVFTVLARQRTLAATAQALQTSPTAVTRRLDRLESALGYALFTRSAGRFTLNRAGASALADAAQMEMAACSLVQKRPAGVP